MRTIKISRAEIRLLNTKIFNRKCGEFWWFFCASDVDNTVTKVEKKYCFLKICFFRDFQYFKKYFLNWDGHFLLILNFFVNVIPYFWENLHLTNQIFASEQWSGKNRLPKVKWIPLRSNSTPSGPKSMSRAKNLISRTRIWLKEDQNRLPEAQNRLPKAQNRLSESKNLTSRGPKSTLKGQKSTPAGPNAKQKPKIGWQWSNLLPDA